jgi:hypothetical protein
LLIADGQPTFCGKNRAAGKGIAAQRRNNKPVIIKKVTVEEVKSEEGKKA